MPIGIKGVPAGMPVPNNSYPTVFHVELTHQAASQTVKIPVQAGTFIGPKGVALVVPTAFNATGAALEIGVEADTDALMNPTSTAIGTISAAGGTAPKVAANSEANLNGYLFVQDGFLAIKLTKGTGGTAGRAIVQVALGVATLDGIDF